jgi:hypothetical protein
LANTLPSVLFLVVPFLLLFSSVAFSFFILVAHDTSHMTVLYHHHYHCSPWLPYDLSRPVYLYLILPFLDLRFWSLLFRLCFALPCLLTLPRWMMDGRNKRKKFFLLLVLCYVFFHRLSGLLFGSVWIVVLDRDRMACHVCRCLTLPLW